MKGKSEAYQIMQLAWVSERTDSFQSLNSGLSDLLQSLISLELEFAEDDVKNIYENFSGGRWFGVSWNGKSIGEHLYSLACHKNKSFATSFEKFRNRKPFIVSNKRLCEGTEILYKGLFFHVTGFNSEGDRIYFAGYKNRSRQGKRTLINFDNKELLEVRTKMEFI